MNEQNRSQHLRKVGLSSNLRSSVTANENSFKTDKKFTNTNLSLIYNNEN